MPRISLNAQDCTVPFHTYELLLYITFIEAFGGSLWRSILNSLKLCCLWCFLQNSCYLKKLSKLNFPMEVHVPSM